MPQYQIVSKSQHAKRGRNGFGGPDHYMAVLVVPQGATVPHVLRADVLRARGIEIHYVGEFYGRSTGPRSLGRQCLNRANALIAALSA